MKRILPALALAAGLASFAPGCSKKTPPPKPVEPTTAPEPKPAEPDAAAKAEDAAAKPAEEVAAKPPEDAAPKPVEEVAVVKPPDAKPEELLVKKYVECWTWFNEKKLDQFKTCFADGFTDDMLDNAPMTKGWDEFKAQRLDTFVTAFPDMAGKHHYIFQIGNQTIGLVQLNGTHQGPLKTPKGDIPATNKKIGLLALHHVEWDPASMVTKQTLVVDMGTMLGQLGISPAPVRPVLETSPEETKIIIASGDDSEKANVETYNRHIAAFNKHDGVMMFADAAEKLTWSELAMPADTDRPGAEGMMKGMWAAFSDLSLNTTWSGAAGSFVVATGRFKGTNDGENPAMKLPKTGKPVDMGYYEVMQFDGGKIQGSWVFYNGMKFAEQLGLLDAPPPK